MKLPIQEIFYSLQGEGFHAGRASIFIRLAGCDVGCKWCDTKESWKVDNNNSKALTIEQILEKIKDFESKFVVITGGEPSLYDLNLLVNSLHEYNYTIALETSGTNLIKGMLDWICLSPKSHKPPIKQNFSRASELKMIITNEKDFEFAEDCAKLCGDNTKLFLQTEWSERNQMVKKIIKYIEENPQWNLSLQLHKILNIE
jgi:organic radical activating enzyme